MRPNITERVVQTDTCIGCGVCDAICPVNVLEMAFNSTGHLQPFEIEGCLTKCTLCLDVCPFIDDNPNEHEIAKQHYGTIENIDFHSQMGYLTGSYLLYAKEETQRLQSASGGAGYWLCCKLLENNIVDQIIAVEPHDDPQKLFKFSIFNTPKELKNARGSVYYPVDLSEMLEYIMTHDGRYAITVLPCYATAIRLAQKRNIKLRKRIKVLIGLVCGQMKTKAFTDTLGKIALPEESIAKVQYRFKQFDKPANEYAFRFVGTTGKEVFLTWSSHPTQFWSYRMFTPNACNSCTDVFALDSDIVLMDAWLPEFTHDYRGHTLVIVRDPILNNLMKGDEKVHIEPFDEERVYQSQERIVIQKHNVVYGSKDWIENRMINYKKEIQAISHQGYEKHKNKIKRILFKIKILEKIKIYRSRFLGANHK